MLLVDVAATQGWVLFVSEINEEVTEDMLLDTFQNYGCVLSMHLNLDRRTGFIKVRT